MSPNQAQEKFAALYAEWEKAIQDPKIRFSSRPQDYTDNEPYRAIVRLGKDVLPLILEKIEQGVFLMNEAALKIAEVSVDGIVEKETQKPAVERVDFLAEKTPEFLSEQQKSTLILKHLKTT